MNTAAAEHITEKELHTVEISVEDRPRLWQLICDKAWSGRYLGKNRFVLTHEQILEASRAGLKFRTV